MRGAHQIVKLLQDFRSAGLGHDAVIEIMLEVLGLMIAILTLISGLLAIGIGVVGLFGYNSIKEEAIRQAGQMASATSESVARVIAEGATLRYLAEREASAMSQVQAEDLNGPAGVTKSHGRAKQRALDDEELKEETA